MISEDVFTLKARNNGVAVVQVKSKVKPDPKGKPLDVGVMRISYDLSGTQDGEIQIDEATGWATRTRITQKLSGRLKMEGDRFPAGGMTTPITIESVIRVEPIEE